MARRLAIFAVLTVVGCEPASLYPEGLEDGVRYTLPRGAMRVLEHPDRLEVFAIARPEAGAEAGGGPYYLRLEESSLATVTVDRARQGPVVRALYRSILGGSGQALCFEPHHALRAQRGDDVVEVTVCLSCVQARFASQGRTLPIDPGPIGAALNEIIESSTPLRFDPDQGSLGGWSPGESH